MPFSFLTVFILESGVSSFHWAFPLANLVDSSLNRTLECVGRPGVRRAMGRLDFPSYLSDDLPNKFDPQLSVKSRAKHYFIGLWIGTWASYPGVNTKKRLRERRIKFDSCSAVDKDPFVEQFWIVWSVLLWQWWSWGVLVSERVRFDSWLEKKCFVLRWSTSCFDFLLAWNETLLI